MAQLAVARPVGSMVALPILWDVHGLSMLLGVVWYARDPRRWRWPGLRQRSASHSRRADRRAGGLPGGRSERRGGDARRRQTDRARATLHCLPTPPLLERPLRHPRLVLAIFILSGAAGLMYEVVWSRQLVLVFGNTTQAVSTILTGFFGGMADRARSSAAGSPIGFARRSGCTA